MSAQKRIAVFVALAIFALGIAAAVFFMESGPATPKLDYIENREMVELSKEIVEMDIYPEFPYSFDYMTEGVQQHLDRDYTYDVIPWQLKGGLLFQGIHRPRAGTEIRMRLLQPATVYFFFHHKMDGGYTEIFEQLPGWRRSNDAPQYDTKNGDHGLRMTMFEYDAQPGIIDIPRTTKDRAAFNIVFQAAFSKPAEPED